MEGISGSDSVRQYVPGFCPVRRGLGKGVRVKPGSLLGERGRAFFAIVRLGKVRIGAEGNWQGSLRQDVTGLCVGGSGFCVEWPALVGYGRIGFGRRPLWLGVEGETWLGVTR